MYCLASLLFITDFQWHWIICKKFVQLETTYSAFSKTFIKSSTHHKMTPTDLSSQEGPLCMPTKPSKFLKINPYKTRLLCRSIQVYILYITSHHKCFNSTDWIYWSRSTHITWIHQKLILPARTAATSRQHSNNSVTFPIIDDLLHLWSDTYTYTPL